VKLFGEGCKSPVCTLFIFSDLWIIFARFAKRFKDSLAAAGLKGLGLSRRQMHFEASSALWPIAGCNRPAVLCDDSFCYG
jgi:hypothetical protein